MTRRVLVSEELLKRLSEKCGFERYKLKLGRWILKEKIGELVGRKGEDEN